MEREGNVCAAVRNPIASTVRWPLQWAAHYIFTH